MKREIKFRVWDSISKSYHHWNVIKNLKFYDFDLEHYTLEQFTGLKDKNDREIYEGDFVKVTNIFSGVVRFRNGSFIISVHNDKFYFLGEFISTLIYEVIGNLHEEPTLKPLNAL
jgi:uncharacterized phage protein (TIGR01671 family)